MSFINALSAAEATGAVHEMYSRQQRAYGYVPDYARTFSHRPELMKLWADLLYGIKKNMDKRRFELVTVAAATSARSTLCSLAHGRALTEFLSVEQVRAIAAGEATPFLTPAEQAMLRFARKIARDAAAVSADEIDELRRAGLSEAEIFDIAAAATARTFFASLCEGLGTTNDRPYDELGPELKAALTVGRPFELSEPERLPES